MANITKVPNGPLIKKKGPYAGSGLKTGGKIKKAQNGTSKKESEDTVEFKIGNQTYVTKRPKDQGPRFVNNPMPPSKNKEFPMPSEAVMDSVSKASVRNIDTAKLMKKKAQTGVKLTPQQKRAQLDSITAIKRADITRKKDSILNRNAIARGMTREQVRAQQEKDKKKPDATSCDLNDPNFKATDCPKAKAAAKADKKAFKQKAKAGAMIKRADGSMSRRGLWDNIRKNKGSGKKPTKQMLVQEKKIKAKSKK